MFGWVADFDLVLEHLPVGRQLTPVSFASPAVPQSRAAEPPGGTAPVEPSIAAYSSAKAISESFCFASNFGCPPAAMTTN